MDVCPGKILAGGTRAAGINWFRVCLEFFIGDVKRKTILFSPPVFGMNKETSVSCFSGGSDTIKKIHSSGNGFKYVFNFTNAEQMSWFFFVKKWHTRRDHLQKDFF